MLTTELPCKSQMLPQPTPLALSGAILQAFPAGHASAGTDTLSLTSLLRTSRGSPCTQMQVTAILFNPEGIPKVSGDTSDACSTLSDSHRMCWLYQLPHSCPLSPHQK